MNASRIALAAAASACAALASPPARADVYKCAGEDGTPIYQEAPCPKGKELRNFQTDPPQLTVVPAFTAPPAPAAAREAPARDARAGKDARPGKAPASVGDASQRKLIRPGMSEGEVLAKLGQPDVVAGNRDRSNARWTYLPAPDDPDTITTMVLTNGKVTDVERKVARK